MAITHHPRAANPMDPDGWYRWLAHCTMIQLDECLRVLQLGQDLPAWAAVIREARNRLCALDERRIMNSDEASSHQHERA